MHKTNWNMTPKAQKNVFSCGSNGMRRYTELCDIWLNGVRKVFAKFMGVSKMACENKFSINAVYIK